MSQTGARWRAACARVAAACLEAGRDPGEVEILAAVKTQPAEQVLAVLGAGCRTIGHNRAGELRSLDPELAARWPGELRTHFIGALQSGRVNQVVPLADCIESVDRASLALRLSRAAEAKVAAGGENLEVLIQVNSSGSPTQGGVQPSEAVDFAASVAELPALTVGGFMTIGANTLDAGLVRASFDAVAEIGARYSLTGAPGAAAAHRLSMGMSGDLEIAIAAGATMVRLGTALFGHRPSPNP